jgi:hypothetical protein
MKEQLAAAAATAREVTAERNRLAADPAAGLTQAERLWQAAEEAGIAPKARARMQNRPKRAVLVDEFDNIIGEEDEDEDEDITDVPAFSFTVGDEGTVSTSICRCGNACKSHMGKACAHRTGRVIME